ncbi:NACHT domain protein [Rubripirellula obstinata]|uniref:NACHT domain protein n=1 Tax=Rubripirellula obstinata TaxID=406547 RepID=A0A5B1CGA1_9BACT|nr:ATP-binding protein [Rubripirellula obstinata]KAA1259586.1 NACHT domain protein [Rubripirellula obstinata]
MNRSSRALRSHRHWSVEPNPFRTAAVRPGKISFYCDDESLIDQLAESFLEHGSGQILGEHGSGKSTLVSSLVQRLQTRFQSTHHLRFVRPEFADRLGSVRSTFRHRRTASRQLRQTLATCSHNTLLVIDGAEQLSALAYHQLLHAIARTPVCVLATSHRKMRRMPVLFQTKMSPPVIRKLTRRQVQRASSVVRNIVEADLASRDLDMIDNLRDYWFDLYDLVQPHLQPCDSYREQQCG